MNEPAPVQTSARIDCRVLLESIFKEHLVQPHPVFPLPTAEQLAGCLSVQGGLEQFQEALRARSAAIDLMESDPLHHGYELPHWPDVRAIIMQKDETYVLGANDSGKTELAGKLANEVLTGRLNWPGIHAGPRKVLLVSQEDGASKQFQQPAVYKYLSPEYRQLNDQATKKRSSVTKLNYSQAGGFTEATFVLPDGAQCWFKTAEQYNRNAISFEGPAYHLVIIDEPAPLAMVQTLAFRAAKVGGKIVFLFTAVRGFDAVCNSVITGARITKTLPMNFDFGRRGPNPEMQFPELNLNEEQVEGCPVGHMPYQMQPLDENKGIIFTWAHWNPFPPRASYNRFLTRTADKCVGRGKRVALVRLFGWVEKIAGCQFPSFKTSVHVLPHKKILEMIKAGQLTSYMSDDPKPSKSHFLLWMGVDEWERKYIFDESPRYDEGEWVNADGDKGDGQTLYAGIGTNGYKRHIRQREREHGLEPLKRKGDPRAFATKSQAEDGGKNFFDLFDSADSKDPENPETAPLEPPFEGAKVRPRISMEIEVINDAFAWNEKEERSIENEPKLFISDRCQNLIRSILNWSPDQGEDSPWKDPIDALRYLFDEPTYHVPPGALQVTGGMG